MWEAVFGQTRPVELASFDRVINALRERFPRLNVRVHPTVARATIPAQSGLDFDIHIALANRDELHVLAGGMKCRWIACGATAVTEECIDAITGLITGQHRIVLLRRFGRHVAGRLQRPTLEGYWQTIARQGPQHLRFTWLCTSRVVRNVSDRREVLEAPVPRRQRKASRRRHRRATPKSDSAAAGSTG